MSGEDAQAGEGLSRHFFTAIWAAAGLGFAVQVLVIGARTLAGGQYASAQALLDVVGGVSWSVIVCGALSLGVAASRQVSELTMGLLGMLGAPLGFSVAKGAQRGVQWLADKPIDQIGTLVFVTAGLKAAEYALLGYALYRLIGSPRSTPRNHALLGAAFGLVFGGLIVMANLRYAAAAIPAPKLVGVMVNEFIFPIGCSVLIYWFARLTPSNGVLGQRLFGT